MTTLLLFTVAALMIVIVVFRFRIETLGENIDALNGQLNAKGVELQKLKTDYRSLYETYSTTKPKADKHDQLIDFEQRVDQNAKRISDQSRELQHLQNSINLHMRHLDLEEAGFFRYKFRFEEIEKYSLALGQARAAQRALIQSGNAFTTDVEELTDSAVINSIGKLGIRAFNAEAELATNRATTNNYEACHKKLVAAFESICKLMSPLSATLKSDLLQLKVTELDLNLEYLSEIERANEEQAELRRRMAEEIKEREEAEQQLEKARDEELKYEEEIAIIRKQLAGESAAEVEKFKSKIEALEAKLSEAHANTVRAQSNAQITRRGHIYIISNIGSFGENVFKIGMTRRTDPNERIAELSNASVPFRFDIHAMIPTDDAPALETALHQTFENRRINRVNGRKEFFRVTIDEISEACQKIGSPVTLSRLAQAIEYRETLELLKLVA